MGLSKNVTLVSVFPSNKLDLLIEFSNGEYGLLPYKVIREKLDFIAYPPKFETFVFDKTQIDWLAIAKAEPGGFWKGQKIWKAKGTLKHDFISNHVQFQTADQIRDQLFQLSAKNCAPTDRHQTYHEYGVYIFPFRLDDTFRIGETVGGGHGGESEFRSYSFEKLIKIEGWKKHFSNAGCSWASDIIENHSGDSASLVRKLFLEKQRQTVMDSAC